jgi:type IX secretion system PorP/SprF family membrane protein
MNYNATITNAISLIMVCYMFLSIQFAFGQETNSNVSSNSAYHNQLFFNRFLINPTFSLVRENKSYLNILHRNQYATFEDNSQNYFLGFSNRLNDNTALGIGVYSRWSGVVQEFGFNANYATSVQLGQKSKLTFGTNITYFNEGLDKNRVIVTENDPEILEANKESKIAIQPAITLSVGKFDFGLYAEDLFKFNQTTNEFLTRLNDKSIKASLQYTHTFATNRGLFSNARLMPLVQLGRNEDNSLAYLGSVLLDLPKYGWLQTTLDDTYGLSMGFGFNLNKKMSLGYLMEKDFKQKEADLGWNHELSLAYTFKNEDDSTTNYVDKSQDEKIDRIVRNYEEQILKLTADKNKRIGKNETKEERKDKGNTEELGKGERNTDALAYENRLILDELILRQDSLEEARNHEFEQRFEIIVRTLRNDLKQSIRTNFEDYGKAPNAVLAANKRKPVQAKDLSPVEHKDYVKLPIKVLDQSDIIGVKTGYYVIANVYKNKKYLNAFMKSLKNQGLDARQFYNKENGLYYVYLADFNFKKDAETAFVSNLNGKYRDEKWIMQIDNPSATVANIYED